MRGEKILDFLTLFPERSPQSPAGDGHAEKKSAAFVQPIDFRMNGLANPPGPPADCLIPIDSGQNRAFDRITERHDDGREGNEVIVDSVSDYSIEDDSIWNSISEIHCDGLTRSHLLWSDRHVVKDEFGDAWGTVIDAQCR
jgi:hypothetical protein